MNSIEFQFDSNNTEVSKNIWACDKFIVGTLAYQLKWNAVKYDTDYKTVFCKIRVSCWMTWKRISLIFFISYLLVPNEKIIYNLKWNVKADKSRITKISIFYYIYFLKLFSLILGFFQNHLWNQLEWKSAQVNELELKPIITLNWTE